MNRVNIALYGRSGSGKTTISEYLAAKYSYTRCSTGIACREISKSLFGTDDKTTLNLITDAMKAIDESVWLRAALANVSVDQLVVFDSMRFTSDYNYFKLEGYSLWKVEAPLHVRSKRLEQRGQKFNEKTDNNHRGEAELEYNNFDYSITNEYDSILQLHTAIDKIIEQL